MPDASLHPALTELMRKRGWRGLTELQVRALKEILSGKNVLIVAPTGEGKTEAALLPLLTELLQSRSEVMPVSILYITPMKSLINDLYRRISYWAEPLGLRVAKKHGDVPGPERSLRLRRPPHILLTTPESLEIDLDWAPKFREYYRHLRAVVVDEVHELLSNKRGSQLLMLLERLKAIAGDFQRVGLSATIPNEDVALELLAGSSARPRAVVKSGERRKYEFVIRFVGEDDWEGVAKVVFSEAAGPTLVFTNSRYTSEKLGHELQKISEGKGNVFVHHSSVAADIREEVESKLRRGDEIIVVCTRTLELGIDIGSIRKVLQVRSAGSVSSLLQRVGRSNHMLRGTPTGIIIAMGPVDFAEAVAEANLALRGYLDDNTIRSAPIDVIAKEVVGYALSGQDVTLADIYKVLSGSKQFGLSLEEFVRLFGYLEQNGVVTAANNKVRLGPTFYKIWRLSSKNEDSWAPRSFTEFFSTIPKRDLFVVKSGDDVIGYVDSYFVYRSVRPGDRIRLAGRTWEVSRIDEANEKVEVVPAEGQAEVPLWKGEGVRRSVEVAREFFDVISGRSGCLAKCDERGMAEVRAIGSWYRSRGLSLDGSTVLVESVGGEQVLIYPFGSKVSETLGMALAYLLIKERGLDVYYRSTFYGLSVSAGDIDVIGLLKELANLDLRSVINKALDLMPHFYKELAEVRYDLGKLGELDPARDGFLIEKVKQDIIEHELDVDGAKRFADLVASGGVRVVRVPEAPSPLAAEIVSMPPVRPWIPDLAKRLSRAIEKWAFTTLELADELGLSEKTVANKLRDMRRPEYGSARVVAFLDVYEGDWRWALLKDLEELVASEDLGPSFTPLNPNEDFVVQVRRSPSSEAREFIVKARDLVARWADLSEAMGFTDDTFEVRVASASGYGPTLVYYHVSKAAAKYILLNAIAAIQRLPRIEGRLAA